jgi:hypothetical protein
MAHIQVAYERPVGDVPVRLLIKSHQEAVWCIELGVLVKWLRDTTTEFSGTTQARTNFSTKCAKKPQENIKINLLEILRMWACLNWLR